MSGLILTIIAIVLVAALGAATLYYGGDIYASGAKRAEAAGLLNQGMQVQAAVQLHKQSYGVGVTDLQELVDKNILNAVPASAWSSNGQYAIKPVESMEVCLEANKKLGMDGIPNCDDPRVATRPVCCSLTPTPPPTTP